MSHTPAVLSRSSAAHLIDPEKSVTCSEGYTLIELLIVTAIFAMMATVLSQIFVGFNQLHRKVANEAILGQDMRYAMEMIVREARNDEIDYAAYGGTIPDVDTILKLKKQNGWQVWITRNTTSAVCGTLTDSCLAVSVDGGTTWFSISSVRVSITTFSVFIRPNVSPFIATGTSYPNDIQPFVTVDIGMVYKAENAKDRATIQAQTTVSSRVYKR